MAENRLPSGVGKKIVQALRKQAEIEIQSVTEENTEDTSFVDSVQQEANDSYEEIYQTMTETSISEDDFSNFSSDVEQDDFDSFMNETMFENSSIGFENNFNDFDNLSFEEASTPMFEDKDIFETPQSLKNINAPKNYAVPANVAVLKRLIMQLPQGVTKQTGAQIIRQTMEALGISMNSVLKEAQQGQDSLTASAKACMSTIAEYKNNIKSLEKQVQDYKKQAIALNDLISLFVMTEK
jgi:hypothetical protein